MWQRLLDYFSTLENRPVERMAFIVGSLVILWILEGAIPLSAFQATVGKLAKDREIIFYCN